MPSANLLLLCTKNHCPGCFWWFGVTAFQCCLGKIRDACHKISFTEFFVAYSTEPLSARGFPAHPQAEKWFSSYIQHGNLASCNGLTRHWSLATPAMCPATCCASRSKCWHTSPPFLGFSSWSGAQQGEKVQNLSTGSAICRQSPICEGAHGHRHSSGRTTQALTNLHEVWENLVFGTTYAKWTQLTKQPALP